MEQEQMLTVCEIFKILIRDDITKILQKMNLPISEYTFLPQTSKAITSKSRPFLFSQNTNIIESIVLEKIEIPGIEFYDFFISAFIVANSKRSQSFSDDLETPRILNEVTMIVKNYLSLSLTSPEFFEGKNLSLKSTNMFSFSTGTQNQLKTKLALQLINELKDDQFRDEVFLSMNEQFSFNNESLNIFHMEFNKMIVFNQLVFDYLDLLTHLCGNQLFREGITAGFMNKKFNNGKEFEDKSFFSIFFNKSILPMPQDPLIGEYVKSAVDRIKACKTKNAYLKTCQVE